MITHSLIDTPNIPSTSIAGIDEAGRGCLAGPVVAGACILPEDFELPGLTDSKKLDEKDRERLYPLVREQAVAWGLGVIWAPVIDEVNILQGTFLAMGRAAASLGQPVRLLLVDGNHTIPDHALFPVAKPLPGQQAIIGGDGTEPCISAASILAKVYRDRLMKALDRRYPEYGFAGHKGYGTKAHLEAIKEHGPCKLHRMTFRGVKPVEESMKRMQACLPGM